MTNWEAEEWRDIDGYKGLYQISDKGRVRSVDRYVNSGSGKRFEKGRELGYIDKAGYYHVTLNNGQKKRSVQIHKLVAETFIPNPNNYPCIDHINGIKTDNRVENLEWVTYSENTKRAIKLGLFTPKIHDIAYINSIETRRRPVKRNDGTCFRSLLDAARAVNDNASNVKKVCDGERKQSKGYSYEWLQEEAS